VQIVIAGKSHPADDAAKQLIAQMVQSPTHPAVRHRITFLRLRHRHGALPLLGVDVWLTTHLRPLEACGTSGNEAAPDGRAQPGHPRRLVGECSTARTGGRFPSADGVTDEPVATISRQTRCMTSSESHVAPRFYDRGTTGSDAVGRDGATHAQELGRKCSHPDVSDYCVAPVRAGASSASRMAADNFQGPCPRAQLAAGVLEEAGVTVLTSSSQLRRRDSAASWTA